MSETIIVLELASLAIPTVVGFIGAAVDTAKEKSSK